MQQLKKRISLSPRDCLNEQFQYINTKIKRE